MTRGENQLARIDEFLATAAMSEMEKDVFRELAQYAAELGYTPRYGKNAHGQVVYLSFIKGKVNRTLMKFRIWGPYEDVAFYEQGNEGKVQLILSFYATREYSDIFHQGVKRVIEEFGGKYTGCYGCGKCQGEPKGYIYQYPDGKKVFRCGGELIELPAIGRKRAAEIKAMLKKQDEFWLEERL